MALQCKIRGNKVILDNGNQSKLFEDLKENFSFDKALSMYALTETEEYKIKKGTQAEMPINDFKKLAFKSDLNNDFSIDKYHVAISKPKDFTDRAQESLYVNGIFTPTKEVLKNSGLFNTDEIETIASDIQTQDRLKEFIENEKVEKIEEDYLPLLEKTQIGVSEVKTHSEIVQDNIETLSRATTVEEVDAQVYSTEDDMLITLYETNEQFKENVINLAINSTTLYSENTPTMNKEAFSNRFNMEDRLKLLRGIQYYKENPDATTLEALTKDIELAGIDSSVDMENFIPVLEKFLTTPNEKNLLEVANIAQTNTKETVNTSDINQDLSTLVHYPTTESENQVYEEKGYIKVKGDIYKAVKKYPLTELYDILFDLYVAGQLNTQIKPNLNKSEFKNEIVKELANTEISSEVMAYKKIYDIKDTTDTQNIETNFELDNIDYLQNEFPMDFNKRIQEEKQADSKLYNEVLKYFKVTHRGIENKGLSLEKLKAYKNQIPFENLMDYSIISNFIDFNTEPKNIIFAEERVTYINNPHLLEEEKNITIKDNGEILSTNENNFIKVNGDVYEKVRGYKDLSLYAPLVKKDKVYVTLEAERPKTATNVRELYYEYKDKNPYSKKKYTTNEELFSINENNFKCTG